MNDESPRNAEAFEDPAGGKITRTLPRTLRLDYPGKLNIGGGLFPSPFVMSLSDAHLTVPRSALFGPEGWPNGCYCRRAAEDCTCRMVIDPGVRVTLRGTLTETPFLPWGAR